MRARGIERAVAISIVLRPAEPTWVSGGDTPWTVLAITNCPTARPDRQGPSARNGRPLARAALLSAWSRRRRSSLATRRGSIAAWRRHRGYDRHRSPFRWSAGAGRAAMNNATRRRPAAEQPIRRRGRRDGAGATAARCPALPKSTDAGRDLRRTRPAGAQLVTPSVRSPGWTSLADDLRIAAGRLGTDLSRVWDASIDRSSFSSTSAVKARPAAAVRRGWCEREMCAGRQRFALACRATC